MIRTRDLAPRTLHRRLGRTGAPLARLAFLALALGCASCTSAPNARFFNLGAGGALSPVRDHTWQKHWHSVVSTRASDGTRLLVFYDRERGKGKTFRYDSSGRIFTLGEWSDWNRDWDYLVSGDFGSFNTVFYRRTDGFLRAYEFTSGGGKLFRMQQNLPDPEPAVQPPGGWDIVVAGDFGNGGYGLLVYRRVTGTARFLRYDAASGQFVTAKSYWGWKRSWDDIAAGDFDGDGRDDLVLYDRDSGLVKIVTFDAAYAISSEQQLANAGRSHGARLAVADFGGAARDDVMLYQHDNGAAFENGSARVWTDDAAGNRALAIHHTHWQDKWTHLLPVDLGQPRSGFLVYSNQHVIKVGVYRMVTGAAGPYTWTATELARLQALEDAMRKTYATAGLRFELQLPGTTFSNATLANWECGEGHDRATANQWVADDVPADVIPITMATGVSGGGGCSNIAVDFARTSDTVTAKTKHYGHEVGHYLGLPHSHGGWKTRAAVESFLSGIEASQGRAAVVTDLDRDDTTNEAEFFPVYDTPPILADSYWNNATGPVGMCSDGQPLTFTTDDGTDVTIRISPHDVMAYNNCNGLYRLTRDQARVVRHVLYTLRPRLIGLED